MIDRNEALRKLAMNVARYSGIAPLASPLLGGIGAILMLHHVDSTPAGPLGVNEHLTVKPDFLHHVITLMKRMGYVFVDMDEAVRRITTCPSGPRFATITADDGYLDNWTEALPVLESHAAPITVYVSPGLVDRSADVWWELLEEVVAAAPALSLTMKGTRLDFDCATFAAKRAAFFAIMRHLTEDIAEEDQRSVLHDLANSVGVDPQRAGRGNIMDWHEIGRAAAHPLVTIGAHTVNHYNLRRLPDEKARREMVVAARMIAERTGSTPQHMAFPYGYPAAVGEREVRLAAEAGFASAVTTRHGLLMPAHASHLCALPRISLNGRYQNLGYVRTMLSGVTTPMANAGKRLVTI